MCYIASMIAAISGEALVMAVVWIIVAGLIYAIVNWGIDATGIPDPFRKVAKVILILLAVLFLVNALLTVAGHPLIRW